MPRTSNAVAAPDRRQRWSHDTPCPGAVHADHVASPDGTGPAGPGAASSGFHPEPVATRSPGQPARAERGDNAPAGPETTPARCPVALNQPSPAATAARAKEGVDREHNHHAQAPHDC